MVDMYVNACTVIIIIINTVTKYYAVATIANSQISVGFN